ncbi:UDP-N-acetylmuramate dehydrogenase [Patescibacteria group bacterium]|nr:UDP-N-acetylmuramate dehydrogenase [Patescibacteria group bacterium]
MLSSEQVAAFLARVPGTIENEPMSKHTSFRIGGPARLYFIANSSDEAIRALQTAEEYNIPKIVFGGGSNLLVSDDGYQGLLIQMANRTIQVDGTTVTAESGAITGLVARKTVDAGLTGFEWAIGVPGTIGGAVYGDAGCYGGEMRDSVVSVDAYRLADGQRIQLSKEDCHFGYRESLFKQEPHLILGCTLSLKPSLDVAAGKQRMEDIMRQRKEKQPLEQSSAGCAFKNFEFTDEAELELLRREVAVPDSMLKNKSLGAGWLVDQAGLLGQAVGQVEVSTKHGNFLVNKGQARAQDVIGLISLIKRKIRDEFGIEMHEEVQYVGFE